MNTQPEALRQAEWLDQWELSKFAATVLRAQHADIERKDALLRQALDAFETDDWQKKLTAAGDIRKELAK